LYPCRPVQVQDELFSWNSLTQEANVVDTQPEETTAPTEASTNTTVPNDTAIPPTAEPTDILIIPTETIEPSETPIIPTETIEPTDSPIVPTNTPVPSQTPIVPTETIEPTDSPIVPTNTPAPSQTPIPPSPVPLEPTVLYPDGSPIMLIHNEASFYVWNPSSERIRAGQFKFESLDSNGNTLSNSFDGSRWTQFYSYIDGGNCGAIEMTTGGHLKPGECGTYNSVVNAMETSDLIFWTGQDRIAGFRVLWNDEEVGRCTIEATYCEVRIP
jgi:hypothetical protein